VLKEDLIAPDILEDVDSEALGMLVEAGEADTPELPGLGNVVDLLNSQLHQTSGVDFTRISEIQRMHMLMEDMIRWSPGVQVFAHGEEPRFMKEWRVGSSGRIHEPVIGGYKTNGEEIRDFYESSKENVIGNITGVRFDDLLKLGNMAARLGDTEAVAQVLTRINHIEKTGSDLPETNGMYFDTLAVMAGGMSDLTGETKSQAREKMEEIVGRLTDPNNLRCKDLPESIWPFLVSLGTDLGTDTQGKIITSFVAFVTTTPDPATGSRRKFTFHPSSSYTEQDKSNAHMYRGLLVANGHKLVLEDKYAYREAEGVRGGLLKTAEASHRMTPELLVDLYDTRAKERAKATA